MQLSRGQALDGQDRKAFGFDRIAASRTKHLLELDYIMFQGFQNTCFPPARKSMLHWGICR
ncbi:hypothetical protein GCM10011491_43410 [Brucella endophytica]|uniref:Uncharacterized protein n=1 Tax=Brucella endophytica TaxID=1963359 RepID=A0A916SQ76_9HYPH|nr:hypothetical protein GCM10011491_43410 [Brucella endophytica]